MAALAPGTVSLLRYIPSWRFCRHPGRWHILRRRLREPVCGAFASFPSALLRSIQQWRLILSHLCRISSELMCVLGLQAVGETWLICQGAWVMSGREEGHISTRQVKGQREVTLEQCGKAKQGLGLQPFVESESHPCLDNSVRSCFSLNCLLLCLHAKDWQ